MKEEKKTLHRFLKKHIADGVIDFHIRAEIRAGETVKFYIHPQSTSGDTLDFLLWENPETSYDLLMPEGDVPVPDAEKFRRFLRNSTAKKEPIT